MHYTTLDTPLGQLVIAGEPAGLRQIAFADETFPRANWVFDPTAFADATEQLQAYFAGELTQFELPLAPQGTPFQQKVWEALQTIPYGCTRSYADIAAAIGHPKAARAVGMANHCNPLPIVIPCHRVIGRSGALVGYRGGLHLKHRLLELERAERHLFTMCDA